MQLSDIILGRRYLLGFVMPGVILAVAAILACGSRPPADQLNDFSLARWVAIVVAGMLLGHAVGHPNFRVVTALSRRLIGRFPRLSLLDERQWVAEHAELVSRVRNAVDQLTGGSPPAATATESDLFDFCKLLLVEKTKAWAARLEERETEINLLAMNVLPSCVFLVVWAVKAVATDPASWPTHGLIPLVGLAVPFLLLRNIYPLQARERQVVFNMFLQHPLLARMDPPKQ